MKIYSEKSQPMQFTWKFHMVLLFFNQENLRPSLYINLQIISTEIACFIDGSAYIIV